MGFLCSSLCSPSFSANTFASYLCSLSNAILNDFANFSFLCSSLASSSFSCCSSLPSASILNVVFSCRISLNNSCCDDIFSVLLSLSLSLDKLICHCVLQLIPFLGDTAISLLLLLFLHSYRFLLPFLLAKML